MIVNIYHKSVIIFNGEDYLPKKIKLMNLLYKEKRIKILGDRIVNGVRVVHCF